MVRIRSREATIVGLVALLAAPGATPTRGAQPYSVVGQSTAQTAATGRRPIAERIKAANRPIRIKAEADLAPDEGLIPDLSADATRDWPMTPPVVELPGIDPIVVADAPDAAPATDAGADPGVAAAAEPAVLPPPGADAVAANPTTADDAGAVGEVGGLEDPAGEAVAPVDEAPAVAATDTNAPAPAAARPRTVAQPRRTRAQVSPQRREALLDRLRAALAEMPRPFGLLPAPAPAPVPRRVRPVAPRAPLAVSQVPPALESTPATPAAEAAPDTTAPPADVATTAEGGEAVADPLSYPDAEAAVAPLESPVAVEATTGTESAVAGTEPTTTPVADVADADAARATEAPLATDPPATAPVADVAAVDPSAGDAPDGEPATSAGDEPAGGTEVADGVNDTSSAVATTEHPADDDVPLAVPQRRVPPPAVRHAPRSRGMAPTVQRQRPFGRLQATLEALPRPLGILPAPRPAMRGSAPQPRRDMSSVARAPKRPVSPAPVSPEPSPAADPAVAETVDEAALAVAPSATVTDPAPAGIDEVAATAHAAPDAPAGDPAVADPAAAVDAAAAAACIEVVVEGPEGGVTRGEEVTLRLSVRNTGNASARAVTPMFHFGSGIEPRGSSGRVGTLTPKGSVIFEALPELAPGESLVVDVIAVCEHTGAVPFRAAVWCGEGEGAEEIPLDGELTVVPGNIASAPDAKVVR